MSRFLLFIASLFLLVCLAVLSYSALVAYRAPSEASINASSTGSFTIVYRNTPLSGSNNRDGYEEPRDKFDKHGVNHWLQTRHYYSYLGKHVSGSTPRPLIMLLHGSARSGASMIDMWASVADRHNLVLIAPDSSSSMQWSDWFDSPALLNKMIEDASHYYAIDRDHIYLFGHSAGGIYATRLALRKDTPFRAVATHAGFESLSQIGEVKGNGGSKPPLKLFLGDKDQKFSANDAVTLGKALKNAGYETELAILKNHSHWYYDVGPGINEMAWLFFVSHW
nr:hypothetical protein [uncultured Cohaesibacter sp.]